MSSGDLQVFCPFSGRLGACWTGPRAWCGRPGAVVCLFPAAAGPGERLVGVKDRAEPGRRSRRRQASLTLRAAIR